MIFITAKLSTEEDDFVKLLDNFELFLQATFYFEKKFISEKNVASFLTGTFQKLQSYAEQFLLVSYLFPEAKKY